MQEGVINMIMLFPCIPKDKIITLAAQINAFISVFLNEPHSIHRYYGELLKAYKGRLFQQDHNLDMYYVSSYALQVVEKFFKSRPTKIDFFYKKNKFKPHILVVLRITICGFQHPSFSSREMAKYCDTLYRVLLDEEKIQEAINLATKIVSNTVDKYKAKFKGNVSDYHRVKNFTVELIEEAEKHQPQNGNKKIIKKIERR